LEAIEPPTMPRLAPSLPRPPQPEAPQTTSGGPSHVITSLTIEGVTAFAGADINRLTTGLVGEAIPEARIEAVRQALVDLYRADGYVYTTVNAVISGNQLLLTVVEGHVAEVKLDGDIGPAGKQVLRFLNNLVGKKPLNSADLERWLLLAQDIPGLSVRSTLNPSVGDPGVLTLIAQVTRRRVRV
jgi:hemolysin activation/secretion protein